MLINFIYIKYLFFIYSMDKSKKRQRKRREAEEDDDDMMSEDDIIFDDDQPKNKQNLDSSSNSDVDMNGMQTCEFVFSGLTDTYFHSLKPLIKPLFEFEKVNLSGIIDTILSLKEDVGTVVKTEDEQETKNQDIELYGIASMIPLTFLNKDPNVKSIINFLILKSEQNLPKEQAAIATNLIKNSKIGLLINERAINLPQEIASITLNFLIKEIGECKSDESYDGKFELDYVVIMSKFVRRKMNLGPKQNKKTKPNNESSDVLFYKYESEYFIKKSVINFEYRLPYEQLNLEYLENSNEPQFYNIAILKVDDLLDVINFLNNENK